MRRTELTKNMKNQTFGVEIEMNHIERLKAAKLAADYFGTHNFWYVGGAYYEWRVKDAQGRVWKFERDSSIHGPDDEKCEMVTPILTYDDIPTLQEIIRILRHNGAISNPNNGCGVHIHIGADGHDARTLRNLTNIMAAHESLLVSALRLDSNRLGQWCKTVDRRFLEAVNTKKPKTMSELADVWYGSQNQDYGRMMHYNQSRYHMLNLHATFTKGTVEFRLFQFNNPGHNFRGGLHAGMMKSYIQLCMALSQLAKEVRNASPVEVQQENEKYAMRTWLLRLGFIGDEFATARDILTRNLSGDAAFRNGRTA